MPRAGLDSTIVTAAAAELADEVGLEHLTMGLLAERLGVRTPSLYKHVDGMPDLTRRIAVLTLTELGSALRDGLQGKSGKDALRAAALTIRGYVVRHPGRYTATSVVTAAGPDDPFVAAGTRVLESLSAVLASYPIAPEANIHALRTLRSILHGFAVIEAAGSFQFDTDIDESFAWLIDFVHRGLSAL